MRDFALYIRSTLRLLFLPYPESIYGSREPLCVRSCNDCATTVPSLAQLRASVGRGRQPAESWVRLAGRARTSVGDTPGSDHGQDRIYPDGSGKSRDRFHQSLGGCRGRSAPESHEWGRSRRCGFQWGRLGGFAVSPQAGRQSVVPEPGWLAVPQCDRLRGRGLHEPSIGGRGGW